MPQISSSITPSLPSWPKENSNSSNDIITLACFQNLQEPRNNFDTGTCSKSSKILNETMLANSINNRILENILLPSASHHWACVTSHWSKDILDHTPYNLQQEHCTHQITIRIGQKLWWQPFRVGHWSFLAFSSIEDHSLLLGPHPGVFKHVKGQIQETKQLENKWKIHSLKLKSKHYCILSSKIFVQGNNFCFCRRFVYKCEGIQPCCQVSSTLILL